MDRKTKISEFPAISLFGKDEFFSKNLRLIDTADGVYTFELSVSAEEATMPDSITLRWRLPSLNVKGVWKSGKQHDKRLQYDWEIDHLRSRISVDAPVISVFGHDDNNVVTFACSDAVNLIEMNAVLREEDNCLYCHIKFFSERHPEIREYRAKIRVDVRSIHYSQALQEISDWWTTFDNLKPSVVPDLARAPLYSTWYNFHQDLDEKTILEECKIAVEMGYKLIILDDGWQTMNNERGYDYTGDWQPDRFPDLSGLVTSIHKLGMKFGLWFSVPFCGKKSRAYQQFNGKFLTENHRWAPVFDPRYPEVRQYLINIYLHAVKTYNLDVLKLDFIDDFRVYPETKLTKENGRDYANVNEAVDRLLNGVMQTLRAFKPDIGIEFRQKYNGPNMRKFGNMFRAFDCPNDPVTNRIRIVDVKLLCGNSAVHSDMLTWHPTEKVEIAAIQVLNAVFGVPQMSILLKEYPKTHIQMVKFYTQYWNDHSSILLDGSFRPNKPLANYPLITAEKGGHLIVGVYDEVLIDPGAFQTLDILNGKTTEAIIIKHTSPKKAFRLTIWNCVGEIEKAESITLEKGVFELEIKAAGMARLESVQ